MPEFVREHKSLPPIWRLERQLVALDEAQP
jgi:hypothetical protein